MKKYKIKYANVLIVLLLIMMGVAGYMMMKLEQVVDAQAIEITELKEENSGITRQLSSITLDRDSLIMELDASVHTNTMLEDKIVELQGALDWDDN